MTENIYHYVVPLPEGTNEAVRPCIDGYTIYTSDRLDREGTEKAIRHALGHIRNHDFEKETSVNAIENAAHTCDGVQAADSFLSRIGKKGR